MVFMEFFTRYKYTYIKEVTIDTVAVPATWQMAIVRYPMPQVN